jgi:lipopolysaccharide/colanic/teichoic acid biosynthesis glycosyltransferase
LFYLILKRIFDIGLAAIGLFFFSPFFVFIFLLVIIEEGLPVFYVKKSLGNNGIIFDAIKFRSMDRDSLYITRIGEILRQTAMDELPQLLNILKGEMSFVGPRNYGIEKYGLPKDFRGKNIDLSSEDLKILPFFQRLQVTPGLAGLAQVFAPKYANDEEVLRWDLRYIQEKNFLLDLRIIFMSVWITIRRRWEEPIKKI